MGALWSRIRGSGGGTAATSGQKGVSGSSKKTTTTSVGAGASALDTDTGSHPATSTSRERSRGRTRTRTPPPLSIHSNGTAKLKKSTSREHIVNNVVAAAGQEGVINMTPPTAQPNENNKSNWEGGKGTPSEQLSLSSLKAQPAVASDAWAASPSAPNAIPHEFVWRSGGSKVCLTGSFDNWTQGILMTKDQSGTFRATVLLDPHLKWYFKFVVDGIWRCSLDFASEADAQGNVNNVIYPSNGGC